MIKIRKSSKRGYFDHGWLRTYHSFSFGRYIDREHLGFRCLRVINEDVVSPQEGFGKHPHQDMEIITYVISGQLQHEDSMGNGSIIESGKFQYMSAGTGVLHSEFNPSIIEPVHLYQIWIEPDKNGYQPNYQESLAVNETNQITLIASNDNLLPNVIKINQDVNLYLVDFESGNELVLPLIDSRYGWIQVISGKILLDDFEVSSGDGLSLISENKPKIKFLSDTKLLFFDLP